MKQRLTIAIKKIGRAVTRKKILRMNGTKN